MGTTGIYSFIKSSLPASVPSMTGISTSASGTNTMQGIPALSARITYFMPG